MSNYNVTFKIPAGTVLLSNMQNFENPTFDRGTVTEDVVITSNDAPIVLATLDRKFLHFMIDEDWAIVQTKDIEIISRTLPTE